MEADRKELDESKQMPEEAESTDPGGDTASWDNVCFQCKGAGGIPIADCGRT